MRSTVVATELCGLLRDLQLTLRTAVWYMYRMRERPRSSQVSLDKYPEYFLFSVKTGSPGGVQDEYGDPSLSAPVLVYTGTCTIFFSRGGRSKNMSLYTTHRLYTESRCVRIDGGCILGLGAEASVESDRERQRAHRFVRAYTSTKYMYKTALQLGGSQRAAGTACRLRRQTEMVVESDSAARLS